jgi:amidase
MARTVGDAALLLSAMAGPDPRSPISIAETGEGFRRPLDRDFHGTRIAWSPDFGELPVDPRVTAVLESQCSVFEAMGCQVDGAQPDFSGADEVFKVLRAWQFELAYGDLLDSHPGQMKDTVVWNVEEGRKLTGPQVSRAEAKRTQLYQRVRRFMEEYAFMLFPVSQVPPFDVTQPYVTEVNGVEMASYIDWMKSCYYVSVLGLPAVSVPCGFTEGGLPVGLQIVGRYHDDWGVLQIAHAFEQATGFWKTRPPIVRTDQAQDS